ncbi:MAG: class I mannose-6-phosphate isomerase [Chloroflexi bacterium]|nr:class I mannose-6-phosphate isomerase [Chloroflexota bacterium]MBI4506771.1 class I mannose-6-phosphate isomerase [Chloroflexota bacterium]
MQRTTLGPLSFIPHLAETVWGGDELARRYGKAPPGQRRLGESWELWDENPVRDGPFAGQPLSALCVALGSELLGHRAHGGRGCPLLLKLIHARELLSVQVHPDDATAARLAGGERGKTEVWYVVAADPGAQLVYGLHPGVDRGAVAAAVAEGTLEQLVARLPIAAGNVVYVPAGTLHAIGAGIVLCEVQQASQLTYRLYDWGRVGLDGQPRPLHVAEALVALHFPQPPARTVRPLPLGPGRHLLAACRSFAFEALRGTPALSTDGGSFEVLLAVETEALVAWAGGERRLAAGEALLLPAALGRYELGSGGTVLRAYVPDLEAHVAAPARAAGWSASDLGQLGGPELAAAFSSVMRDAS